MNLSVAMFIHSVPFTRAVLEKRSSLGGSESAGRGLMEGLARRGHDCHIFATQLEAPGTYDGVDWHPAEDLDSVIRFASHDVFISLRMPHVFTTPNPAKLRVFWSQDLLIDDSALGALAVVDRLAFVSQYHREQWVGPHPYFRDLAYVTRNGIDPRDLLLPEGELDPATGAFVADRDVYASVPKRPHHFIHVSRPERGHDAILAMWPQVRARIPDATLAICRYSSMYDAGGWGKVCEAYDQKIRAMHDEVGGIEWLGELDKPTLYRAIAAARVMWYPTSQDGFAETNCWAADTPVAVPGGSKRIDQVKAGDLVLSYSERERRIVAKRVKWCRRTGTHRPVMRLTYKWRHGRRAGREESIVGTANHRMLRRHGAWTTLGELKPGDSLMPLFRKSDGKYWEIGHTGSQYRYEQDVVGEAIAGRPLHRGEVVHHRDGDGTNNHESNLDVISQSQHIRGHHDTLHAAARDGRPWFDTDRLHRLRADGLSQRAIAQRLGTTQTTISRRLAASNHTVVSVTPAGFADVWDMEVEDTHTFIAGHVVVHNCIAATEAQACGAVFLGSYRGALSETVHPESGVLIDGDYRDAAVQRAFVDAAERLVSDDADYQRRREVGRAYALPRCSHDTIAEEWDTWLQETFETRYRTNKIRVLRQLLRWDNHVAAQQVATEIIADHDGGDDEGALREAREAAVLCDRVIRQEEQSPEDYATFANQSATFEAQTNERFRWLVDELRTHYEPDASFRVLDVACGNGSLALAVLTAFSQATYVGFDYSPGVLAIAQRALQEEGLAHRATFHQGGWEDVHGVADVVFCGEFIEHIPEPWRLLDRLEQHARVEGRIYLTTPCGPFADLLARTIPRKRGHLHSFSLRDIATMLSTKRDAGWQYLGLGQSPRGSFVGYWCLQYAPGGGDALPLDYQHTIVTERPLERIAAMLIVRNEANNLRACLETLWPVVDAIYIGDCGSTDETRAIAEAFDPVHRKVHVFDVPWLDHFAAARNVVLRRVEADGYEWGHWQDADERLEDGTWLPFYVESPSHHAFVVEQRHITLDMGKWLDKPLRTFRLHRGVQFFGIVHEQPEEQPDAGIFPALHQTNAWIAHFGYHTDAVRRRKMTQRNLALMKREIDGAAPRELAWVLWMRDLVNVAGMIRAEAGGQWTVESYRALMRAVKLYDERFRNPKHKLHEIAWGYYQLALTHLKARTIETAWTFAAAHQQIKGKPRVETFRVRDTAELREVLAAELDRYIAQLEPGRPIPVAPVVPWDAVVRPTPEEAAALVAVD